jgi:hypothetical protein
VRRLTAKRRRFRACPTYRQSAHNSLCRATSRDPDLISLSVGTRSARHALSRCLIPADGFYEFTDLADKTKKRKDKWLFTKTGEPWFCVAGIWRTDAQVGEAFTMLTMPPGPDIAPYHDRQIAILDRGIGLPGLTTQSQPKQS